MAIAVRKTRPGAVRRPSRSRPQRLAAVDGSGLADAGAHQRLRRRSSERERESNAGPLSNPGVAVPSSRRWAQEATGKWQVRDAADGWVVALQMDGCASSCAWVASPVRSQQRAWVLRTAPIAAGAHPIAAAAAAHLRWRASARQAFFLGGRFTPSAHNCEAVRVSVGTM